MGIFNRMEIRNLSIDDPKAWDRSLWNLAGSQSLAGETVNEETALTYSAVWNAITLISGTVSTLPLHLLRKNKKKTVMVTENPLFRVLHDRFNPWMTAQVGREVMTMHILTWGNCYAEIVRDVRGNVVELWPIAPNRVRPEIKDGELIYNIMVDSEEKPLPRSKILHILGPSPDGFMGYSVIALARKGIGLSMALETFGSLYFGKGTHPSAVITHPSQLKDPKAFREGVSEVYGGLGKSHQVMVLEDGMTIQKIGIPPEDSQFLESRQFQIPEIARFFNLPPHKLKDLTKSSFSNIEQEQISFVVDSIMPWLVRFEQNYMAQLLSKDESYRQSIFIKHNVDGLLRGDSASRGKFYQVMFSIGAYSINDVRELEDKDPIDGGDEHFVPLNMIPVSKVSEYFLQKNNTLLPSVDKEKDSIDE